MDYFCSKILLPRVEIFWITNWSGSFDSIKVSIKSFILLRVASQFALVSGKMHGYLILWSWFEYFRWFILLFSYKIINYNPLSKVPFFLLFSHWIWDKIHCVPYSLLLFIFLYLGDLFIFFLLQGVEIYWLC